MTIYLPLGALAIAVAFLFLVWCPCAPSSRRSEEERKEGEDE